MFYSLYIFLAFKAIEERQLVNTFKKRTQNLLIIFFSLIIGLREEVGCDWDQYKTIFNSFYDRLNEQWFRLEPSYYMLNSIFSRWEYGFYFVNLVCGVIVSYCLIKFCENLPRPWLGLCVAYPYFITVVAMGYTRQSVSISLSLLAFLVLEKGQFYKSIFYIILGATFHRSGFLFLFAPLLYTFQSTKFSNFIKIILLIPISNYFLESFLFPYFIFFRIGYLDQNLSSTGSLIRIILCVIPSFFFIFNFNKFKLPNITKNIFLTLSIMSIMSLIALRFVPSSTAVDRFALNLIPIQILVASYVPDIGDLKFDKFSLKFLIVLTVFFVLSVWLIFATHSFCWIPYRNIIF